MSFIDDEDDPISVLVAVVVVSVCALLYVFLRLHG